MLVDTIPATVDAWLRTATDKVRASTLAPSLAQFGRVLSVSDGIARVSGLPDVRLDEILRFARGQMGFAMTLDRDAIGCVLFDDAEGVEAGDKVYGMGEVVRVPVGKGLLGRIVDPLGRPLDGKGAIEAESYEPVERPAPTIIDRDFVTEPLQTGVLVIDAMFALGRGQRELIIGDRAIGKTALAVDTIINQRRGDVISIYVAIGQKSSTVKRVIDAITTHGAPSAASSSSPKPHRPPGCNGSRLLPA